MNRREISIMAIITFFTVLAWVTFGIYHARKSSTVTKTQLQQTIPLTPTFDTGVLSNLSKREE